MKKKIIIILLVSLFSTQLFAIKKNSTREFIKNDLPVIGGLGLLVYLSVFSSKKKTKDLNFDVRQNAFTNYLSDTYQLTNNSSDVYGVFSLSRSETYKIYGLSLIKNNYNNIGEKPLSKRNLYGIGLDFNINQSEKLSFEYLNLEESDKPYFLNFSVNYRLNF